MVKSVAFANALAVVMGALYIICAAASIVAPNLVIALGQTWAHTINLEAIKSTTPLTLGGVALGFVSLVIATWVVGYVLAIVYNFETRTLAERPQRGAKAPVAKALR